MSDQLQMQPCPFCKYRPTISLWPGRTLYIAEHKCSFISWSAVGFEADMEERVKPWNDAIAALSATAQEQPAASPVQAAEPVAFHEALEVIANGDGDAQEIARQTLNLAGAATHGHVYELLREARLWLHAAYDRPPQTPEMRSILSRIDAACLSHAAPPSPTADAGPNIVMGSAVQKLGALLADLLDEDQWGKAEQLLIEISAAGEMVTAPAVSDEPSIAMVKAELAFYKKRCEILMREQGSVKAPAVPWSGRTLELKTDPQVYQDVEGGKKPFELRLDDRGYQVGDDLLLKQTQYTGAEMKAGKPLIYTGKKTRRRIGYILRGPIYGLADGWVIAAFADAPCQQEGADKV